MSFSARAAHPEIALLYTGLGCLAFVALFFALAAIAHWLCPALDAGRRARAQRERRRVLRR